MSTFNDDVDFTFGGGENFTIAASTMSAGTKAIYVQAATVGAAGSEEHVQQIELTSGGTFSEWNDSTDSVLDVKMKGLSASTLNYQTGLRITTEGAGGTVNLANGILINTTGTGTMTITDAIDASHADIVNALNAGQNWILHDGVRTFSPSSGNFTLETTGGTDLLNVNSTSTQITISSEDNERLCHSGTDGTGTQYVYLRDCLVSGEDYAEYFGTDGSLEPGDLVSLSGEATTVDDPQYGILAKSFVERSTVPYDNKVVGIISTNPYSEILGEKTFTEEENPMPVALAGQAPVKVSTENGEIQPGDPLTSSSTPGVAMRATESGPNVGKALEPFDGSVSSITYQVSGEEFAGGKIMVFVSVGWFVQPIATSDQPLASSFTNIDTETLTAGTVNTQVLLVGDVKFSMNTDGDLEIDGDVKLSGDLTAKNLIVLEEVKAPKTTTEKLNIATPAATPDGKNNASIGTDTIIAGQTSIVIETTAVTADSKIFVTPTTKTDKVLSVTTKVEGESFTVEVAAAATEDVEFNWWVVN